MALHPASAPAPGGASAELAAVGAEGSRVAVVFGGQGASDALACVHALAHSWLGQELAHRVASVGLELSSVLARGGRELEQTRVYQPVVVAAQGLLYEKLPIRERVEWVAGHSMGELSAWAVATGADWRDVLQLAAWRGQAMARSEREFPGGMVAVEEADLDRLPEGEWVVGARNQPGEAIISAGEAVLKEIEARVPSRRLRGVGPWHGPWLEPLQAELRERLTALRPAARQGLVGPQFVSATSGRLCAARDEVDAGLVRELAAPVLWSQVLETLASQGVTDIVVVGPSRAQRALITRNLRGRVRGHSWERPPPGPRPVVHIPARTSER